MSRIKSSFILVFVIIVAIVGISILIPEVFFSESNSEARVGQEWTPVISTNTPTQTTTATSTPTLQLRTASAVSPTPTTDKNCVFPLEYWEEHPELWLDLLIGNTLYTKDDIRTIFDLPSPEIYQILLQQLYLSNLNLFSGADPKVIKDVLGEANQWLQEYLPDEQLSGEAHSIAVQLAQTLAAFNSGLIGSGFCSPFEKLTVTPLVIPSLTPTTTQTATATRVIATRRPNATATKDKDSDEKPEPTDPPRPTKEPGTPVPPQPTKMPTSAPTDVP